MTAVAVRLDEDQLAVLADEVARRLALIQAAAAPAPPGQLVDATELAEHLGVSVDHVRRHRDRYGAIRVGAGPRGRLRFDLAKALEGQRCVPMGTPRPGISVPMGTGTSVQTGTEVPRPAATRRRAAPRRTDDTLLTITGPLVPRQ